MKNCPICNQTIEGKNYKDQEQNYFIHIGKEHDIDNGFYQKYKEVDQATQNRL